MFKGQHLPVNCTNVRKIRKNSKKKQYNTCNTHHVLN